MSILLSLFLILLQITLLSLALHLSDTDADVDYENDSYNYDNYKHDTDNDDDGEDFHMLISGGYRPVRHTLAKYLVSIRTTKPTAYFGDNHFCAGALIAAKLVLTAAHCVTDQNKIVTRPRRLTVVAGAPNRLREDETTMQFGVIAVIPHSKYVRKAGNDIALLRLKDPIPELDDNIKIISITHHEPKAGTNCSLLGWGQLYEHGPYTAEAVYVNLIIFNSSFCKQRYPHTFGKGMFCAGDMADWGKDACHGDSGGPLICNHKLVGIVSWGVRCGFPGYPTVFTDVYYHRNWIEGINVAAKLHFTLSNIFFFVFLRQIKLFSDFFKIVLNNICSAS